ncbi:MAG: 5'/3'-nucleotidase SurE [Acidobacteriia bacterium]|mgnify:CR=1 FL=1|nr:5'/3'-nucleotidase SurE [Terriglobia bacterium]
MTARTGRNRVLMMVLLLLAVVGGVQPQASGKFLVLLTNDDGYDAPGLRALVEAFRSRAEIVVAAPATEQSGKGHSITTSAEPIFLRSHRQPDGALWYAIEAPPATCVRLAVESLLPRRPDLVVSGINRGENLGITVYLSGTVGAAREAAIVGLPAIAVSMRGNRQEDYAAAAAFVAGLVEQLQQKQALRPGLFLNVNVPAGERRGVRVARLSLLATHEDYERRESPRGRVYYWSRWRPLEDDVEGTDVWAFARGYITLTPMTLDVTDVSALEKLRGLETHAETSVVR